MILWINKYTVLITYSISVLKTSQYKLHVSTPIIVSIFSSITHRFIKIKESHAIKRFAKAHFARTVLPPSVRPYCDIGNFNLFPMKRYHWLPEILPFPSVPNSCSTDKRDFQRNCCVWGEGPRAEANFNLGSTWGMSFITARCCSSGAVARKKRLHSPERD